MTASADAELRLLGGRYRLAAPIGHGAMGVVWHARDELLGRDVAVKEVRLPPSLSEIERDNGYQRTLREARTSARLTHPAVATVYDVVEERGRPWIVMELVPGRSLDQILAQEGPLSPELAAAIGRQLLAALAAAHAAGVLHRDVKPSNVLLSPDGRIVLTDFGIATIEGDPSLTQAGIVMGSPGFLAPERLRGGAATPASDLWSLGATLYAAVEGQGPYDRYGGVMTVMAAVVTQEPPPPRSAGPLTELITALLSRDPSARPSAAAAARMLAAPAAGEPSANLPAGEAAAAMAGRRHADGQTAALAVAPPSAPPDGVSAAGGSFGPQRVRPAHRRARIATFLLAGAAIFLVAAVAASQLSKMGSPGPAVPRGGAGSGAGATAGPQAGGATAKGGDLPAGFRWYTQPANAAGAGTAGFKVAVPTGWLAARDGLRTVIAGPGTSQFVEVDLTPHRFTGMLAEVLWLQRQTLRSGAFPGYHRYYLRRVPYLGTAAADWAFSWRSAAGGRIDVLDRVFVAHDRQQSQSFALYLSTPAALRQASGPVLREVLASFRPIW